MPSSLLYTWAKLPIAAYIPAMLQNTVNQGDAFTASTSVGPFTDTFTVNLSNIRASKFSVKIWLTPFKFKGTVLDIQKTNWFGIASTQLSDYKEQRRSD